MALGGGCLAKNSAFPMDRHMSPPSPIAPSRILQSKPSPEHTAPSPAGLGTPPHLEADMPFNPFRNSTFAISSPYEVLKSVIMLPVCLIRMILFAAVLFLGLMITKLALVGATDVLTKPFPIWRRRLLLPVRILARVLLFLCGFHWIRIKGSPAPRDQAPILVCNHVTFVDPVFIFFKHLPVIVTAQENLSYPVMGAIIRAMQVIAINRGSPDSRRIAGGEIKRRARCNDWSRVMIFPEATTTNGRALVSFKAGAFNPGYPVQPMLVRYPHVHLDPAWVAHGPTIYFLLFRLMTQFHNFMEVEYLPAIEPTLFEQRNPRLFAERVRMTMAKALNVMVTEHSFEDLLLIQEAQKMKDFSGIAALEFGKFEKLYKLNIKEAKAFYSKFRMLDAKKNGVVNYEDFVASLGLPDCGPLKQVFSIFDSFGRGCFTFRQYAAGFAFITRQTRFKECMEALFRILDRDDDGILSIEDVVSGLKDLIPETTVEQAEKLWNMVNMKRSKYVSRVELFSFLETNPEYVALFMCAESDLLSSPKSRNEGKCIAVNEKLVAAF